MTIPHRIVAFQRVTSGELRANPKNFRRHPVPQLDALRGSINELGKITPLIAYRDPDWGLTLVDGHARLEVDTDEWDVAIIDLTPEEADLAMAVLDPLAAMAETDTQALDALLCDINTSDVAVRAYLKELEEREQLLLSLQDDGEEDGGEKGGEDDERLELEYRCPKCGYQWKKN